MTPPFSIVTGDITSLEVGAIVNAANSRLLGGGGVDGAIHRAAGKDLLTECELLGGCKTGAAKLTRGYKLPAPYIIHTVGPIWNGGKNDERKKLASCYHSCLRICLDHGITSVAFPCISTGVYRFPKELATDIAIETCLTFIEDHPACPEITFCCFEADDEARYLAKLATISHE